MNLENAQQTLLGLDELAEEAGLQVTSEIRKLYKDVVDLRRNVFLTGGAGVGKSTVVTSILIPALRCKFGNVAVVASTGAAASRVAGRTLHSWAGLGIGPHLGGGTMTPELRYKMIQHAAQGLVSQKWWESKISSRILNCDCLFIDEISMLDGNLLDYFDHVCRIVRQSKEAFGGIQLVSCGDFLQLPVVTPQGQKTNWAFRAISWAASGIYIHELTTVFRQKEAGLVSVLNNIRNGEQLTAENRALLKPRIVYRDEDVPDDVPRIVARNNEADRINLRQITKLPTQQYDAEALYYFPGCGLGAEGRVVDPLVHSDFNQSSWTQVVDKLQKRSVTREVLPLRVGMKVMITVNCPQGSFVNGTCGKISSIKVDETSGRVISVAVEYVSDLTGELIITGFNRHPNGVGEGEDINEVTVIGSGPEGRTLTEPTNPMRYQFPIIPAYALTVHKTQGATLEAACIDLRNVFEDGQAYVALSRVRSLEGLYIVGSLDFRISANAEAVGYMNHCRAILNSYRESAAASLPD